MSSVPLQAKIILEILPEITVLSFFTFPILFLFCFVCSKPCLETRSPRPPDRFVFYAISVLSECLCTV